MEEDDSPRIFCRCPRGSFDTNTYTFSIHHTNYCPYFFNTSLSEENWQMLKDQGSRLFRFCERNEESVDFVPVAINFDNSFRQALNRFRSAQLIDNSFQVGRGQNLLKFNFFDRVVKKSLQGGVHFRISRINIVDRATKKLKPETKMRDLLGSLGKIFHKVIEEAKNEAKVGDKVQLIVSTEKSPAYDGDSGMEYPIATPFFGIDEVEENMIIPFLFRYFKKYEHITVGDQLVIETVLIRDAKNISEEEEEEILNGSELENVLKSINIIKRKKGIIRIQNTDKMCLARAVVVCLFYNEWGKFNQYHEDGSENQDFIKAQEFYDKVRHTDKCNPSQKIYAKLLCDFCEIDSEKATKDIDIKKVAEFLHVEIKIVNFETLRVEKRFGNSEEKIYLLRRKIYYGENPMDPNFFSKFIFHFDSIISMSAFLNERYCKFCDVSYKDLQSHKCKDKMDSWCSACFRRNCSNSTNVFKKCTSCEIVTRDEACLKTHVDLHICHTFWCHRCGKKVLKKRKNSQSFESLVDARRRHKCEITCNLCGREKKQIHKCFMLRQKLKEPCRKLLFLDFETDQSSGVHKPVYCFLQWVTFGINEENEEVIISEGEKEFGVNYLVFKNVGDFIFSEAFRGYTCIAHNMKGFDGCFLLNYLFEQGIFVTTIANGQKLNSMEIPSLEIRVIDSLNFLQMSLAALPAAIGVESIVKSKGFFPHFFTSPTTLNYIGPLPNPEFFGCFDMKDRYYSKFMSWYNEELVKNPIFDFQESMKTYCKQDVKILKAACLKFRKLVMEVTRGIENQPDTLPDEHLIEKERIERKQIPQIEKFEDIHEGKVSEAKMDCFDRSGVCDPFSYMSVPGMCSAIFKSKFLKKNAIAQILPAGYENHKHSLVACEYLEYLKRTKYKNIQYALNTNDGKEVSLCGGKFRVDGFDPTSNTVVEFHGCFWHGCPECIKNPFDVHPVRKVSYEALLRDTLAREEEIKNAGYRVESIWECQWTLLKKQEEVFNIVKEIHIKSRLQPRKAFQGGRTETRRLIYDIKNSKHGLGLAYQDICSLYPTVNCKEYYPIGHPKIITSDFEHYSKYFGLIQCAVLPPQNLLNGVLPAHINGKLMFPLCRTCAEKQQVDICKHGEVERVLYGVWVSEELKQAERNGYQVKQIFCVHHFERKSNKLFEGYIKTFFKLKLLASKRPSEETDEELDQFIKDVKQFEGIELKAEDFKENPGMRCVCKLCCNCLWGRLGMRDVFPNVDFVRDIEELQALANDNNRKISTVRFVSKNVVAVLSQNRSIDTVNFSNNTNVYLAVFTTAYARIRLYNLIKKVEDRFVYCDTDSVFYEISPERENNLSTGKFMGDLTNELDNDEVITEFVSGGPKVYAFKTSKGRCVIKIKGFQLCKANSAAFSFENLKRVIINYVNANLNKETGRVKINTKGHNTVREKIFKDVHCKTPNQSSATATFDAISSYNPYKIKRTATWKLVRAAEQKIYMLSFDKRIILENYYAVPYGYVG